MGKSISGTVLYELKVTNPNAIANFSEPKLADAAAKDFIGYIGRQEQGFMIKGTDAKALVEKVKKDMVAKKVKEPWLRAGISGTDLILLVTDLQPTKYEQSATLFAGYVAFREKHKNGGNTPMVLNAQKGDKVIDESSERMAKAKGTTVQDLGSEEMGGLDGTTPIILLAHGSEDKSKLSQGAVWGQKFAGMSPDAIVKYLLSGDKKQRLSKSYSGTIYLDGCFTAQVSGNDVFVKKVWEGLKAKGLKNVKVKGNLGAAVTEDDGTETITTPEAERKAKELKLLEKAQEGFANAIKPFDAKQEEIWQKKYAKKNDEAGYEKDPEIIKLKKQIEEKRVEFFNKYKVEGQKIPGFMVPNLIGQFGLEVLK